jgi:hypothetical protein
MVARRVGELGSKKKIRTGVSISQTELCAADIRLRDSVDRAWRVPLDPPPSENGHWPSLATALADLARTLGVTEGTLAISLMPPFTEVRKLDLPPLRDDELQRVLARSASRYFVNAKSPQIVGASIARRTRGAPTSVIATAAPARLLGAIRNAANQAGWTIEVVAPAEGAWAAAAVAMWPAFAKQHANVLVAHDDRTDLIQIENGRLVDVRRFRAGATDAAMIAETIGSSVRIGALGAAAPRRQLTAALSAIGVIVTMPSGEWAAAADRPDLVAAHFAGTEIGPVLRSEDAIAAERVQVRKTTWRIAGVAAALLVMAAAVELWGVHRQLGLVRAERARIRPEIASTMVGRTTVDAAYRHLTTLAAIERASPHWSTVITTLTDAIPDDAFLLAVRTRDDSLIVDGLAERARRVFDALEKAEGLIGVRAAAPVRRELQDGGTEALEHFAIAARVVPPRAGKGLVPASNPAVPAGKRGSGQ